MRAGPWLTVLLLTRGALALDGGAFADAGSADAGLRDAGVTQAGLRDAGRPDAGAVDAGQADAGAPLESWVHDGGEELGPDGVTDVVTVRVGFSTRVSFGQPVTMRVCDAPLVEIGPDEDALTFTGVTPGQTQCGFWFLRKQTVPQRLVRVVVLGATPDAGARAWWAPGGPWRPVNE